MYSQIPLINPVTGQILVAILIFSTTIAFLLRMYVRIYVNRTFCWDDGWLIASQTFLLIIVGLYFEVSNTYNKALETNTEPPNDRLNALTFFGVACYILGGVCLKISLALFFKRLAQRKWQRQIICGSTILYLIPMSLFTLLLLFRCGAPALPDVLSNPHCKVDWPVIYPIGVAMGVANAINYTVLVGIPAMIVLGRTSLSAGAKASVVLLLILAVIGWSAAILRVYFMQFLELSPTFWMRIGGKVWVISVAETAIGTTIISLATLKSLIADWKHRAGRAVAHMQGREYSRDSTVVRMVPRHQTTMMPTVTYHDMTIDFDVLKTIGVLPDIEEDLDEWKPRRPEKAYQFAQSAYLPSIGEVISDDQEPARNLSTG